MYIHCTYRYTYSVRNNGSTYIDNNDKCRKTWVIILPIFLFHLRIKLNFIKK